MEDLSIWHSLLSGAVGSIIVLFFTLLKETWNKKERHRALIKTEEIDGKLNLVNHSKISGGSKIIITKEYNEIIKLARNRGLSDEHTGVFNYLSIKNLGPKIILDAVIKIKIIKQTDDDGIPRKINVIIPYIEEKEEVFIPTDSDKDTEKPYSIQSIIIKYKTAVGEKLKYSCKIKAVKGKIKIIEIYSRRFLFIYWRINKIKSSNLSWNYIVKH